MSVDKRPLGDWIAIVTLIQCAGLLCIITYQGYVLGQLRDLLHWLTEKCVFVLGP